MTKQIETTVPASAENSNDYYNSRLKNVGLTPEDVTVRVEREGTTGTYTVEMKLIEPNEKGGIDFFHAVPNGVLYEFRPKGDKTKHHQKWTAYKHTRNHPDQIKENPALPKCLATFGEGALPWLSPLTLNKSIKGEKIDALWVGEGAFKVASLQPYGLCGIGIQGIQNTRFTEENETKILHPFISQTIENCNPGTIIYFQDADCRDIKDDVIFSDANKDMLERSRSFFSAINNFQKAALPVARRTKAKLFFVAIKKYTFDNEPKGLDDLLQVAREQGKETEVLDEIKQINKGKHRAHYKYFSVFDISRNTIKVNRWFCLHSHKEFAELHISEIEDTKCRFGNKIYFVEQDKNENIQLELLNDSRVNDYMKIGTSYYKKCQIPFDNGKSSYMGRLKTDTATIKQQIGAKALNKVRLFDGFCNIPNYKEHREAINGFFNIQHKLPQPIHQTAVDESQMPTIFSLFNHIAKNANVKRGNFELDPKELLLDYVQLLLFHRAGFSVQRLPILALVSEEEGTGKSTFGDFLINELLGDNHLKIQNSDFSSDFNEPYATRRAVTIEEASFAKKDLSRLKDFIGSDFILVNGKNDKQAKFSNVMVLIMVSNDEKRFSFVSKDDTRHWVIKIDTLQYKDVSIKEKIRAEIPYFYKYLLDRQLYLENLFPDDCDRYYFPPYVIRTRAWAKAVRYSLPKDCEPIRDFIEEMFFLLEDNNISDTELCYTVADIKEMVFDNKGNDRLYGEYLRDYFNVPYKSRNKVTLKPQNARYTKYSIGDFGESKVLRFHQDRGKCFVFDKKEFITPILSPQAP